MKTKKMNFINKGLLVVGLLILSTVFANAQQTWTIGPKAGASFSRMSNVDNAQFQTGLTGGVFAVYSKWRHWGFSTDLMYTEKVSKYDAQLGVGDNTTTVTLNPNLKYIEMPILANYYFMDPSAILRPKIVLGPSFGYLISDQGSNPLFNTFDFGVVGGIGANVRLTGRIWLNIDGRYNQGFLDITEADSDVMNQSISATAGIGFGIGE